MVDGGPDDNVIDGLGSWSAALGLVTPSKDEDEWWDEDDELTG